MLSSQRDLPFSPVFHSLPDMFHSFAFSSLLQSTCYNLVWYVFFKLIRLFASFTRGFDTASWNWDCVLSYGCIPICCSMTRSKHFLTDWLNEWMQKMGETKAEFPVVTQSSEYNLINFSWLWYNGSKHSMTMEDSIKKHQMSIISGHWGGETKVKKKQKLLRFTINYLVG